MITVDIVNTRVDTRLKPAFKPIDQLEKTFTQTSGVEKVTKAVQSFLKAIKTAFETTANFVENFLQNRAVRVIHVANQLFLNATSAFIDFLDFVGFISGVKEAVELLSNAKEDLRQGKLTPIKIAAKAFILPVQIVLNPLNVIVKWGISKLGFLGMKNFSLGMFRVPIPVVTLIKDAFVSIFSILNTAGIDKDNRKLERKKIFEDAAPSLNHARLARIKYDLFSGNLQEGTAGYNQAKMDFKSIYVGKVGHAEWRDDIHELDIETKWEALASRTFVPKRLLKEKAKVQALFADDVNLVQKYLRSNIDRVSKLSSKFKEDLHVNRFKISQDMIKLVLIVAGTVSAIVATVFPFVGLFLFIGVAALGIGLGVVGYKTFLLQEKQKRQASYYENHILLAARNKVAIAA